MIKEFSLKAFQLAINQGLKLDQNMPDKLKTIDDKLIELIIEPLQVRFFMHFTNGEIHLMANAGRTADTTIHASPIGLIRLSLLPASQARSLFNEKVRIKGDIELGQKVKEIFDSMDIDWEGHLANFTGDVIAHQMGQFVSSSKAFADNFSTTMQQNISEYLQEELRALPSREECEDLFKDIDAIRLDTDRVEAKFQQIGNTNETD